MNKTQKIINIVLFSVEMAIIAYLTFIIYFVACKTASDSCALGNLIFLTLFLSIVFILSITGLILNIIYYVKYRRINNKVLMKYSIILSLLFIIFPIIILIGFFIGNIFGNI